MKNANRIIFKIIILLSILGCGGLEEKNRKFIEQDEDMIFKEDNLEEKNISKNNINKLAYEIEENYRHYNKIDPKILAQIILGVPKQGKNPWACGYIGAWHIINAIRAQNGAKQYYPIDLTIPGKYPVSLEFDINLLDAIPLGDLIKQPLKGHTDNNIFRVGALPDKMGQYINDRIHKNYTAKNYTFGKLSKDVLFDMIKKSIDKSLPLLTIIETQKDSLQLHYWSIVGYYQDEVLILDSDPDGIGRIKNISLDKLLSNIDLSSCLDQIKMINNTVRFLVVNKEVNIPPTSEIENLQKYNLIIIDAL
jgi:hypothetical protein